MAGSITTRGQRACMVCSIIQSRDTFVRKGCPNCEEILNLTGHRDAVDDCTSQVFEGYIALADPSQSWVAKWQRLDGYKPGTYAVKVVGNLPEEVIQSLEDNGIKYIPRDGSAADEEGAA